MALGQEKDSGKDKGSDNLDEPIEPAEQEERELSPKFAQCVMSPCPSPSSSAQ